MTATAAGAVGLPRIAIPLALDRHAIVAVDRTATIVDLAGTAMGTGWRVRLVAAPGFDARPVRAAIDARLDALVAEMSHWRDTSLLRRFDRAAPGTWLRLPPDFAGVIAAGLAIAQASGGAFDPAIGRLTDLWGLGPNPRHGTPGTERIAAARARSGWRRLAYDPRSRMLRQPGGVWLDLSGIAKGHAADAVAALLAHHGHAHALIEIGGECVGRGIRPDGDPWWVELEAPPCAAIAPLRVALHQLAVATSGSYVRGAHTLDPRTGHPVAHATDAVSVLHRSAMIADAWATALSVLPAAEALALAARHALAVRLIEGGREHLSPALHAML